MSLHPEMPNVFIASDHAGFSLKAFLVERLRESGYGVTDMGAESFSPEDDYPDFITPCATRVAQENPRGEAARVFGVVIGGSGEGEAMAANRVPGIRAAVFYGGAEAQGTLDAAGSAPQDRLDIIRLTRAHNDANILSLGARFLSEEDAWQATRLFLETPFSGEPRHIRRLAKY